MRGWAWVRKRVARLLGVKPPEPCRICGDEEAQVWKIVHATASYMVSQRTCGFCGLVTREIT